MRVLTGPDDVAAAAQAGSFPAVLKPVSGMGGSAVQRVDGPLQLSAAYERAGAIFAADPRMGHLPVEFILEELIPGEGWHTDPRFGDQVSVESLVVDGVPVHLAVTDKLPLAPPFREIGDILPSSLDADAQAAILAAASAAIRAIGVGTGATHTEIKLTGDGPRIIEVNGRLGGPVADLLTTAYGFDVIPQLGRMALGGTPDLPVGPPRAYAGYITPHPPPRPVQVGSCDGEERARALDGVLELLVDQRRGDRPRWQLGERGRLFRAWVEAPTAPGVLDLFARLQETLDFRLEPVVDHE